MSNWFIIIVVIIIIILAILAIIMQTLLIRRETILVKKAFQKSFKNNIFCQFGTPPCKLEDDDTLVIPTDINEKYDYDTARFCADIVSRVEIAVWTKKKLHIHPKTKLLKEINYKESENPFIGIVISDENNRVWIAFRGTVNLEEWEEDIQYQEQEYKDNNKVLCHAGFLSIYHKIKNQIMDTVDKAKPSQIIITGHSLGSALATLISLDLANKNYLVYVYLFASPRVCNREFALEIEGNVKAFYRINNMAGMIPTMPDSVMPNLDNPDNPYFYQHIGEAIEFTDNWESIENNHSLPVYIANLKEAVGKGKEPYFVSYAIRGPMRTVSYNSHSRNPPRDTYLYYPPRGAYL